jgi:hypothetical protein
MILSLMSHGLSPPCEVNGHRKYCRGIRNNGNIILNWQYGIGEGCLRRGEVFVNFLVVGYFLHCIAR